MILTTETLPYLFPPLAEELGMIQQPLGPCSPLSFHNLAATGSAQSWTVCKPHAIQEAQICPYCSIRCWQVLFLYCKCCITMQIITFAFLSQHTGWVPDTVISPKISSLFLLIGTELQARNHLGKRTWCFIFFFNFQDFCAGGKLPKGLTVLYFECQY